MAENNVEPEHEWSDRALDIAEDTLVAMETLLATLRAFEDVLRQQELSVESSTEYCDNFCQALMHYAGSRNSIEHGLPLLEVYCLSINCFAAARSHLTAESDRVALVLKRLALSCFELLLSVPENEIPFEAWVQFHHSVQVAHETLVQFGSTDLQALLQITGEGGAWSSPILTSLLTGQPTNTEEVDAYISLEGEGFMEMRVKHLEKMGELAKAVVLAKACTECCFVSNQATFRQTYVSLLCHLLPNEEAIMEISRLDCKDVLEITCNLETEGEENTAFILCTTFLTQQLQQQSLYCSWELILLWSKLQKRIDPSLISLLERCLQLGAIATTVHHLLCFVRVIQSEAKEIGVPASVELCVKALQLPKQEDSETRISVCKTVSCLLSDDLEVIRACLLTEFLLGPCQEVFGCLEELYLRPDQKFDQENEVIPNSLRCELLLALKAYWPFDPEFWDWKTLKYHCVSLLGVIPESEGEEEEVVETQQRIESPGTEQVTVKVESDHQKRRNGSLEDHQQKYTTECPSLPECQRESQTKQQRFCCRICRRSITDLTQAIHHSKRHAGVNCHPCPVCLETFKSRKDLVPHMKIHIQSDVQLHNSIKKEDVPSRVEEDDEIEPGEITVDPSLMLYYKSTHDPDVLQHIMQQAKSAKDKNGDDDEHITFEYIHQHFKLQNRDEYQCPGTGCPRIFKHSKYLYVHLKSEHKGDENVKHFHQMRDKREKCLFCRRHLVSAYHHCKHKRAHCGDTPYACVVTGCGAQFGTSQELVTHKQSHSYQLNYQCELKGCYVTCSDLGQIYHHEAQHFRDAAFTCISQECKKYFLSKQEFIKHLSTHSITFSEEDFEAQRKAKRKRFKAEVTPQLNKSVQAEGADNEVLNSSTDSCDSTLQVSDCKEPKATMTLVAVCFDGSKFTCGFEKCGMSFSRARDVQRHLKCAHPEHLKLENKEHVNDKGQGTKTTWMKAKTEPDIEGKVEGELSTHSQLVKSSKDRKECTQPKNSEANAFSMQTNDVLKEILIGLSNLDLNSASPHSGQSRTTPSIESLESNASQVSPSQPVVAEPSFVVLQKDPEQSEEGEKKVPEVKIEASSEEKELKLETSIESLANAKPYNCEVKGCSFRTAQSYSLLRHYNTKHGRTVEQAKRLTSLKTTSFKPYMCHLCPKSHREKHVLKAHYIHAHNLSESLVDKISYASVQHATESRDPTISITNNPELPREHDKKDSTTNAENTQNSDNHSPSEEDGEGEQESREEVGGPKEETDESATQQVRTRRLVAKSNLCYILDKFSKPFHCVAKNCDAAFSTQGGLVRHLQLVHHYNRSQLLLETDVDEQTSAETRKETSKKRPLPNTDEPQPQHRCHFVKCKASYHLKSSLVRHTRDCHSQPPEPIRCKYEGCAKVFSHDEALRNHMLYNHCEYYNSLVVRLQSTHNKSVTGCQKKLIVAPQSPQKDEPDSNAPEAKRSSPEPAESVNSTETPKEGSLTDTAPKSKSHRKPYSSFIYRSHEEALQMCQDRCLRVAYPCMVQDCDSVVTYMGSLHRHYLKVHRMGRLDLLKNENKLVLNAEQLEEVIQRKSARPTATGDATPDEVPKMEEQAEQENPEELPPPVNLDSVVSDTEDVDINNPLEVSDGTDVSETVDGAHCLAVPGSTDSLKVIENTDPLRIPSGTDPLEFPEEEQEEAPVVERNGVLLGADEVLYGELSTGEPTSDSIATTPTVHKSEKRLSWEKLKPLLRPVTVDLSLPCSLLTTSVEGLHEMASYKDGSKKLNGSALLSFPPVRQPLKRKNELSEQPANLKDSPPSNPPPATFDITTYKPASFESSFLRFIQDTAPKDKTAAQTKHRDTFRRGCSVKENNQLGLSHTRSRRSHSSLMKSNAMTGDLTSAQSLKSILDKALAGCGDLAIKQLQYLRPVVVLERPMFINIPPNSNNSKLLLGS